MSSAGRLDPDRLLAELDALIGPMPTETRAAESRPRTPAPVKAAEPARTLSTFRW